MLRISLRDAQTVSCTAMKRDRAHSLTLPVLVLAAVSLSGSCARQVNDDGTPEARAFRAMHVALAALEEGQDPEGIENRLIDAERVGLAGPCRGWFERQVQGARAALALLCDADPAWRQAAEELRAELHQSPCLAEQARDPGHADRTP